MKWQPIDTAPKDGTHILLWEQWGVDPFVGWWRGKCWTASHEHVDADGGWNGAIVVDRIECPVTHWMPIPAPPYPAGDVSGPCVCGSWPGGKCLQCPVVR